MGAYLGEAVRQAYAGSWQGTLEEATRARVEVKPATLHPFLAVQARLLEGARLELDDVVPLDSAHATHPEWARKVDDPVDPPTSWGPATWPTLQEVGALGRALSRSVVSLYCEQFAETALDHSLRSLAALDSYLTLVAPPDAPPAKDSPAVIRVSVLIGAYVGEVLRKLSGGHWRLGAGVGADGYLLQVGDVSLRPIQQVLQRVEGRTSHTMTEYVRSSARRLGF
jgi:hypothetical protein